MRIRKYYYSNLDAFVRNFRGREDDVESGRRGWLGFGWISGIFLLLCILRQFEGKAVEGERVDPF